MTSEYEITTDTDRIDPAIVHRWLAEESYWARGRSAELVARSMANSICFGAFDGAELVGFARVVTDRATFAWLCDVFVDEAHRGRGVGGALVAAAVDHPELAALKRFVLATADAHEVYRRHGFEVLDHPERWMMRRGTGA
ncbi:MAG TPA: GNAT family N-acetyltransferase [Acidimicrobiia bacterium]|nr:GNAT family N-acetyltransferase [Acidimicrobiia bacterium]